MQPKIDEFIKLLEDAGTLANGNDALGRCASRDWVVKGKHKEHSTCLSRFYDNQKRWKLKLEDVEAKMCRGCEIAFYVGQAYAKAHLAKRAQRIADVENERAATASK